MQMPVSRRSTSATPAVLRSTAAAALPYTSVPGLQVGELGRDAGIGCMSPALLSARESFNIGRRDSFALPRVESFAVRSTQRESIHEDPLQSLIVAGDVLFVKGGVQFQTIGANGGFMGHVLLALSSPQRVDAGSDMAVSLRAVWPKDAECIWRVHTVESTRSASGLHQAEMLIHMDKLTHCLWLVGELSLDHSDLAKVDSEAVQVWQSPPALRERLRPELVTATLKDMGAHAAEWSLATAARAVLFSGSRCEGLKKSEVLKGARACWRSKPICTSIVIVFWQRYLCKFAQLDASEGDAAELIQKWMPLKADRTLPGTLQAVLKECNWSIITRARRDFRL